VEGEFGNPYKPDQTISPSGHIWYGSIGQGLFNFKGKTEIDSLFDVNPEIDYSYYEWLARNIKDSTSGKYKVKVFTSGTPPTHGQGGCFTLKSLRDQNAQADGTVTLAVFNTSDDICLAKSDHGRDFGPSVLAPFSKLTLNANYIDGVFIAKNFVSSNGGAQLHGEGYDGPIECIEGGTPPPPKTDPPIEETVTEPPVKSPVASPTNNVDCEDLVNLGYDFSKATGPNAYSGYYPHVRSAGFNENAGKDDSIAVFVGGSYTSQVAAEVEGRMVVLKDLTVQSGGAGNFVSVGVGTHVLPNSDTDCIMVGGNIVAHRDIQVFNQKNWMGCRIVYKGSATNIGKWKNEHGSKERDPNYDMSHYEAMKDVFYKKSQYWKTLPTTKNTRIYDEWGGTNFQCTGTDEIQVFNIQQNQRSLFTGDTWGYVFNNNCKDKTILINFQGTGNIKVNAVDLIWNDKKGYGNGGFPVSMTSSIMWNFPDASNVEIGNGRSSEFQGSVLITGNMKMTTTGHSGRTIVLGNLVHNKGGSEFHNYPFDPPKPLPEPDCDDYLLNGGVLPPPPGPEGELEGAVEAPPTEKPVAPTNNPTKTPPTKSPTKKPTAPSGGGGSGGPAWGSGCKKEWDNGCSNNNDCCDGLYCKDEGWGKRCMKKNNPGCVLNDLQCDFNAKNPNCCNGLTCKGDKWYAKCLQ